MANEKNLTPVKTKKEARIRGKNGGIKSGIAKRERKTMKEQLQLLMSLEIKKDKLKQQLSELGIPDTEQNNQMAMNVALYQQALKGNTKAYELIRDTSGEKPVDKVEQINPPSIVIERPKKKKDES